MTDQTYNGWTNYATWGVALVLNNDEGTYGEVREQADAISARAVETANAYIPIGDAARINLAEWLQDYTERLCGLEDDRLEDDPGLSMMAQQVIGAGLADVDWDEIARVILGES